MRDAPVVERAGRPCAGLPLDVAEADVLAAEQGRQGDVGGGVRAEVHVVVDLEADDDLAALPVGVTR